jgi:hypothetical protein
MTARTSSGKKRAGEMNAGAGQPGKDSWERTASTGQPRQGIWDRTASENNGDNKNQDMQRGQDGQNMTARRG